MKRLRIRVKELEPHETSCLYIPHSIYIYIYMSFITWWEIGLASPSGYDIIKQCELRA